MIWGVIAAVAVVCGVGAFILGSRRGNKRARDAMMKVVQGEVDAEKLELELGRREAVAVIKAKHAEELEKLDDEAKLEAEKLSSDPVALSDFLVNAGKERL